MNDAPRLRVDHRMRIVRWFGHVLFDAPRERRASEIAAWSNALASLAVGAGVFVLSNTWPYALGAAVVAFVLLRAALTHRHTVWFAAAAGTLTVAGAGGALAWLFAHALELSAAPPIAAAVGAVASAIAPTWAYGQLAQRRASGVRDSLLAPASSD